MNSQFLRRVLVADAVVSGAAGLVMIIGAGALAPLLSLPEALLIFAGATLMPWTVALIALARMADVTRAGVRAVIAINVLWVAGSITVLFVCSPNPFGYGFVIAQAVAVGAFAELQIVALKREPSRA